MRRREFVALGPAGLVLSRLAAAQDEPAWRFRLDDELRWTLEDARGAPLIGPGRVVIELRGQPPVPLAQLEQPHRNRGGDQGRLTTVIGRAGDVEVNARFVDGRLPRIAVQVRGLDMVRDLAAIRFGDDLPAPWSAAWINGYGSASPCDVVHPGTGVAVGHGLLALAGGRGPLALAWGSDDAGAGAFLIDRGRLGLVAEMRHRAVGADHPPAVATLTVLPGGEALDTLGTLVLGDATLPAVQPPAGWIYAARPGTTLAHFSAAVAALRERCDPRDGPLVVVGAGYQRAPGDWEPRDDFPGGHAALTAVIRDAGFRAGLWLAPFAVTAASGIPTAHAEWLLEGEDGRPLVAGHPALAGPFHVLDASQRAVQDHLRQLTRHAGDDWGYEHLVLDALHLGALGHRAARAASPHEALRAGLRALREGASRTVVHAASVPWQCVAGYADGVATGPVPAVGDGIRVAARNVALRLPLHGRAWRNDPGPVDLVGPLSDDELRTWAGVVALSGGATFVSGPPNHFARWRAELLPRLLPAAALELLPARLLALGASVEERLVLLARADDDWAMVLAINWSDAARAERVDLAGRGLRGSYALYDPWTDRYRGTAAARVTLALEPRASVLLGLRRSGRGAFVAGSTRHLVQGAVDIAEERWDARRRTLSGRSVRLDARPYTLTLVVPAGMHPRGCTASVACQIDHDHREPRVARLVFPNPEREIAWEVGF